MPPRPSISQLEVLVQYLEENPGIARGELRTIHAKIENKKKWAALATTINTLGEAKKDGVGWAKYWAEKKCALKKQYSALAASMRLNGGLDTLPISPLDVRLMKVVCDHQPAADTQSRSSISTPEQSGDPQELTSRSPLLVLLETTDSRPPTPQEEQKPTVKSEPLQSARKRLLRRRRRVRLSPMSRMLRLEERRAAAEHLTAQAFSNATDKLDRCASALEQLSEAVREGATTIANALLAIAVRLPN